MHVYTEEKYANGLVCHECGFNPETSEDKGNRLTVLSIMYGKWIVCLRCACK